MACCRAAKSDALAARLCVLRSIGTESYLALPKGGIDDNHVLIVPVSHHANTVQAPDAVVKEMGVFANALRKYVPRAPAVRCPARCLTRTTHAPPPCLFLPPPSPAR